MPEGLDIDYTKPLARTAPFYDRHIALCTGRSDWPPRIEEEDGFNMAKELKRLLGRKRIFFQVRPTRCSHGVTIC
jgi:hypothetical protein